MPLVLIPAVEIFGALILGLMGIKLAQAIVRPFDIHIPVIGNVFHGAIAAIENGMVSAYNAILRPYVRSAVDFFKAVADVIISLPAAIVLFAAGTVEALDYLRHVAIRAVTLAILVPYAKAINALEAADIAIGRRITGVDNRLGGAIDDLRDFVHTEVLARLLRGIDRLRSDVYDTTVPALHHLIHAGDVALEESIGVVRKEVTATEREIAELAKRLDIPLSVVEALIASVGIVAALEAIQTLGRCAPKLRTLCQYDPLLWEEFLLATLGLLAFPGLREMVKLGATAMEDLSGAIKELGES